MEEITIKQFLSGSGSGYGSGYGYGSDSGYGDGSGGDGSGGDGSGGDGYGSGYGYGYGDGSGGDGYGSGYGDGSGSGSGDGSGGDGYGSGSGDGDGYGSGSGGYGSGSGGYGYGDGSGYGDGDIKLGSFLGSPVHYIDTLPCVIRLIKGDIAAVDVIDTSSFLSKSMFVAKKGGLFAHGDTIRDAIQAVEEKWSESRSLEEKIAEFKTLFKKSVAYDAHLFYQWHSILTGSCQAGKAHWIEQQGIDLDKPMTVETFFGLTKNAYGGEAIRQLMEEYE